MRKRPQPDDVPLAQQVEDLLVELEAFFGEHGKYPASNKPGVPRSVLYAKRARLLMKQGLTTAQVEALKKTQCFQRQKYLTLKSKNEGFLCEEHSSVMQRLTVFLKALEANGEDPRLPVCAKGMDEDERLLRRELDVHKQKLDEAV